MPKHMPPLDRIPHFDVRSRNYTVRRLLPDDTTTKPRVVWQPRTTPLDQGSEGACVGFAFSGDMSADPWRYTTTDHTALALYEQAQAHDRQMGNYWPSGASVLAGAKAAQAGGWLASYAWAFGIADVIDTIINHGPVILGIPWYSGMYSTSDDGLVSASGEIVGGHAIMANGYHPDHPEHGEVVEWTNSWGPDYGLNGTGYVPVATLAGLLADNGEACVPTDRPLT